MSRWCARIQSTRWRVDSCRSGCGCRRFASGRARVRSPGLTLCGTAAVSPSRRWWGLPRAGWPRSCPHCSRAPSWSRWTRWVCVWTRCVSVWSRPGLCGRSSCPTRRLRSASSGWRGACATGSAVQIWCPSGRPAVQSCSSGPRALGRCERQDPTGLGRRSESVSCNRTGWEWECQNLWLGMLRLRWRMWIFSRKGVGQRTTRWWSK